MKNQHFAALFKLPVNSENQVTVDNKIILKGK